MKRNLFLLIIVAIILLSACKTSNNVSGDIASKEELDPKKIGYYSTLKLPIDNNYTEITMIVNSNITGLNDTVPVKELRRRTGINLQLIEIPTAVITNKVKVILSSKQSIPDIVNGIWDVDTTNDFGMQGAFEEVDKHFDELPNFKEIFIDKAKENGVYGKIDQFKAQDGHLYLFPRFDCDRDVNHGMLYRKDIFDKHNIPVWNNSQGFYEALKKLKSIYPNSLPFVSKNQVNIFRDLGHSWGIVFPLPYYDEDENVWKHSAIDEKLKNMLDFLKKLYDEGLIDPEFITDTQASWTSKMTQAEKAFTTWDWIGRLDMFKQQTAETVPDYDLRYAYPIGPTGKIITMPKSNDGPAVKKGKNSLIALKLLDYLISPSGAQLTTMGVEGVTYEMGSDGFAKYYGFENEKPGIDALEEKHGLFVKGLYRRFDKRSTYYNFSEREKEAQDMMLNKEGGGFLPEDPIPLFNSDEKAILNEKTNNITKNAQEFVTKYVLGSNSGEAAWNEWIKKAKDLGVDEVIEIYNNAQKRFDNK